MKNNGSPSDLERSIRETGRDLLKSRGEGAGIFDKSWWYGRVLSWTMEHSSFKTRLFHFIDVLPVLETPKQILAHLKEYFKDEESSLLLSGIRWGGLAPALASKVIKQQVREMAKIFIAGRTVEEALKIIEEMRKNELAFTIDFLEEATLSEKEGIACRDRYLNLIEQLARAEKRWQKREESSPLVNISVKITSLCSQIYLPAWEFSKTAVKNRLRPIMKKAVENSVFLNIDVERYQHKTFTLEIFKELLMEPDFKTYPHFGIVIQSYLRESFSDLQELADFAKKRGVPFTVRLVKGAYWDSEILTARQKNWPVPVWTNKADTDANFETCIRFLLENHKALKTAVGSHNVRSVAVALALHKKFPKASLEFQALYGMGDSLVQPLKERGYTFRLYVTVGELIPGMSYLVRRLLENTANQSFIRSVLVENQSEEETLAPPKRNLKPLPEKETITGSTNHQRYVSRNGNTQKETTTSFANHPTLDFSLKKNRDRYTKALKDWKGKLPLTAPILISGREETSSSFYDRENPSDTGQTIGRVFFADKQQGEKAVQTAVNFFQKPHPLSPEQRVERLKKLGSLIAEKEFLFSALETLEVGKSWSEAQADVAEAVDFCNYYGDSFLKLAQPRQTCETAGENNVSLLEPVGVTAVIAPWNFPLAILAGMTVAPLVCGNPVIIKPAEQSALIAFEFAKLLLKSGFPPESFAFLPGRGEETGAFLVERPEVSLISFTGSFEVGAQIIQSAGRIASGQTHIKRCVVEMGGKNAIVVDESADLDMAVEGVLQSAFSFQGQKCSACSRLIVLKNIYDRFMERFLPALDSLPVGRAEDPQHVIGPVVDQSAFKKIQSFIQKGKETAHLLYQGKAPSHEHFIAPTVFLVEDVSHPLMQEEIFGPVLAVLKAGDPEEAFSCVNQVKYGLTAGFYSRHPGRIERFKSSVDVGNVYINRNCTGALVERHPFGGRKRSGLGSKTGQAEYLKHFLHTKVVSENTMRRGFSPEIFTSDFLEKIKNN